MQLVMPTFGKSKQKRVPDKRRVSPAANQFASELEDEFRRMCNEWFFPWHHAKSDRGMSVDDFNGRKIRYANIGFSGSSEIVYWAALDRYLRQKIASAFITIEQIVADNTHDPEYELGWLTSKVNELTARVAHKASETYYLLKGAKGVLLVLEASRLLVDARAQSEYLREAVQQRKVVGRSYFARVIRSLTEPEFVGKIALVLFGAVAGILLKGWIG